MSDDYLNLPEAQIQALMAIKVNLFPAPLESPPCTRQPIPMHDNLIAIIMKERLGVCATTESDETPIE